MNVFLHIPKTAGSTIIQIFRNQYKNGNAYYINGSRPNSDLDQLIENKEKLADIDFLFGHIDFGVSDKLPLSTNYITILRHPIERVISHFCYVKREPTHYLHSLVDMSKLSLREYVESGLTNELDNGQVRILTGAGGYHKNHFGKIDIPYGKCNLDLLEEAKKNVNKNFPIIGIQEMFLESLILFKKYFNLKSNLVYENRNQTYDRLKLKDIDDDTISSILKYNNLDLLLYNEFYLLFKERVRKHNLYVKKEILLRSTLIGSKRTKHYIKTNFT